MEFSVTNEIMEYLKSKDEVFDYLYSKFGLISIDLDTDLFSSVVVNIIGQMLSKKAADNITSRFLTICNNQITAESILTLDRENIRSCGLSYSKADYILEFSKRFANNEFDFSILNSLNDVETIKYLKRIKGVGSWTAEMLALFCLGRENIFSYDDVALKNGIIKAKGYKTLSKKRFEMLRKKYTPYCSYASLYFYRLNDSKEVL